MTPAQATAMTTVVSSVSAASISAVASSIAAMGSGLFADKATPTASADQPQIETFCAKDRSPVCFKTPIDTKGVRDRTKSERCCAVGRPISVR